MVDVLNPADFKYCVSIKTPANSTMYALTNDDNITYGDVLTSILHEANYKIIQGDINDRTEHLFLKHNGKPRYDLYQKVIFKNYIACVEMIFDSRAKNHNYESSNKLNEIIKEEELIQEKKIKKRSITGFITNLFIKKLDGNIITLKPKHDSMVIDLKYLIQDITGIPPNQQRLIFNNKNLDDEKLISYYDIIDGDRIHMVLNLRGGMFHETSGRNGNYNSVNNLYFSLDNRDISKHYIPADPLSY